MADTPRTRAALLVLMADNVSGQISEQDLRDFMVTAMPEDFINPADFWVQPVPTLLTTERSAKGWIMYSQIMLESASFGAALYLAESNTWGLADVSASAMNPCIGLALASYLTGDSQAQILRRGLVYLSTLSVRFSGYIGRPIYLLNTGSISVTPNSTAVALGIVEADGVGSATSSKFRFDPQSWAVTGI